MKDHCFKRRLRQNCVDKICPQNVILINVEYIISRTHSVKRHVIVIIFDKSMENVKESKSHLYLNEILHEILKNETSLTKQFFLHFFRLQIWKFTVFDCASFINITIAIEAVDICKKNVITGSYKYFTYTNLAQFPDHQVLSSSSDSRIFPLNLTFTLKRPLQFVMSSFCKLH